MSEQPPILEVQQLTKQFKKLTAVNGISFKIPAGICFGLLGPNGAGKTTTIEMMERITQPSSGKILYKGETHNPNFKNEAGIQFQSTALMDFLTVKEVLVLFSSFYRSPMPLATLEQQCHLSEFMTQPANKLSGGQKQRLLLALALVNDPDIVFLDEPTTGLDPQSRRNFWKLIENIKARGKTVILTTHYMDEAEQLCDHLLIVDQGQIVTEGSPQALLKQHFGYSYVCVDEATIENPEALNMPFEKQQKQLVFKTEAVEETLQTLIAHGVNLTSLLVRNPTLDDLFLKLTGHTLRD